MKKLVVYFTRTNTTKIVAEALAGELGADIEELNDKSDWQGAVGWVKAGRAAMSKAMTTIEDVKCDPRAYEFILLGTPVWAGTMTPAIRTYIDRFRDDFPRLAFFATQGSQKRQRVFDDLKEIVGKDPLGDFFISAKEFKSGDFKDKIKSFTDSLGQKLS